VEQSFASVFRGPSVYSRRPVIRYALEPVAADEALRRFDPVVVERLLACLPGLGEHCDACKPAHLLEHGIPAGDRAALSRLFEHFCIELQNLSGVELECVRANGSAGVALFDALVPYDDERVATEAARLSLDFIGSAGTQASPRDTAAEIERRIAAFLALAERHTLPVQDRAVVRAAMARDIPVIRIAGRLVQLGQGPFQQRLSGTQTTRTNVVGNKLAANKDYSRRVLAALGLPVPRYERIYRERDAVAAAERIGFPVVVKPNNSNMGRGVSIGIETARDVRRAYRLARGFDRSVIVEAFVAGRDFRMLVVDGRLEAAAERVPAHVVGDARSTVEELVRRANSDPRRGAGQRNSWTRLALDEQADRLLGQQGHGRSSVPPHGEMVLLRRNANTSSGGTARDVTDEVHPENREIAERAAAGIGLDVAGVDLLVQDITRPMRDQAGVICEINSKPGVRKHLWPAEGRPRDVIGPIVDMLFPPGSKSRIPIVAVAGSGDTAALAERLAQLLAADGTTVGLVARGGVFVSERRRDGGGLDGCAAARMLLLDPDVEAAVIELVPNEVLAHGLGYDRADACVIVNDDGADVPGLAEALRVAVGTARETIMLPDGDELGRALALCLGLKPGHFAPSLASWSGPH